MNQPYSSGSQRGALGGNSASHAFVQDPHSEFRIRVNPYSSVAKNLGAMSSGIRMIAGPALVSLKLGYNGAIQEKVGLCTFRITKQLGTFTPSTAVVIPSDSQGPVDIILESSTNLVDWVLASPGTYGTSSQLRHFRVRAVRK
jgi:hypothetical protein